MRRLLTAVVVTAGLLAGCGGEDGSDKKISNDPNSPDYVNPDLIQSCQDEGNSYDDCVEIWGN